MQLYPLVLARLAERAGAGGQPPYTHLDAGAAKLGNPRREKKFEISRGRVDKPLRPFVRDNNSGTRPSASRKGAEQMSVSELEMLSRMNARRGRYVYQMNEGGKMMINWTHDGRSTHGDHGEAGTHHDAPTGDGGHGIDTHHEGAGGTGSGGPQDGGAHEHDAHGGAGHAGAGEEAPPHTHEKGGHSPEHQRGGRHPS